MDVKFHRGSGGHQEDPQSRRTLGYQDQTATQSHQISTWITQPPLVGIISFTTLSIQLRHMPYDCSKPANGSNGVACPD